MAELKWGLGPRPYDQGVEKGVLYLDGKAVPWNGLTSVDELPVAEADATYYFDGRKTHVAMKSYDYRALLQAYTYPDVFSEYNGYSDQETYRQFGLSYRTEYGDGYQIHLVYNALVVPKQVGWGTLTQKIDPTMFGWDISASSTPMPGARPAAHLIIDSASLDSVVRVIERHLYGSATTDPYLPTPEELIAIYEDAMSFTVTYNGDGTYTMSGDDELVWSLPNGRFYVDVPTLKTLAPGLFQVSSFADV